MSLPKLEAIGRARFRRRLHSAWIAATTALGPVAAASPVIQSEESVDINWTTGEILATGSADPKPNQPKLAAARLEAESRAIAMARVHMRTALEKVWVTPEENGQSRLQEPEVKVRVLTLVEACPVRDTRYYSGGGVDVVIVCQLAGGLGLALSPLGPRTPGLKPTTPSSDFSSVILVLPTGSPLPMPILLPVLKGPDETLFHSTSIRTDALRLQGGFRYAFGLDAAKRHPWAGNKPLLVNVFEVKDDGFQVLSGDVDRLRTSADLLYDGRVVVALPPR